MYFFVATFIVTILTSGSSYAAKTYTVRKGDNPYKIAKKFNVNLNDIIKMNGIDPDRLKPGTRITIPPRKSKKLRKVTPELTAIGIDPVPVDKESTDCVHEDNPLIHIVKKGDTISALSKKYSVPAHKLMAMNNLRSSHLKIGQTISIKNFDAEDYVVQKGDTIWDISRRFDIDPDELKEINSIEMDSLRPGQKILLKRRGELPGKKPYEAILSQGHQEENTEQISEYQKTSGSGLQERITLFAKRMLDIPYRFGGNSLLGIDCSAYVKKVYSMIGIDLPRSAREQFKQGVPIEVDNLSIGDLVFFRTYASYPSHVGIYLGNNLFIHASSKSKKVTIDSLNTPFYLKRFIGAKRLLNMSAQSHTQEEEG